MDSTIKNDKTKVSLNEKFITNIGKVKSKYILKRIFNHIFNKKLLEIIRYNKKMQNRLDISIKTYIKLAFYFSSIEIEIIPSKTKFGKFINITEFEKIFYHIYFNDNNIEIKNKYAIKEEDKVEKIKIIINYQIRSFEKLFQFCECIKSINFKKFSRININNMSYMFYGCTNLKSLNLSNFITYNVKYMSHMFANCSSLEKLNLSNFDTQNVYNMSYMFSGCSSLKKLKISNFKTNKTNNMSFMFYKCSSLKEINLSNFNTENVTNMEYMFYHCSSLKELDVTNFNTNKLENIICMFYGCSSLKKLDLSKFKKNKKIKDQPYA